MEDTAAQAYLEEHKIGALLQAATAKILFERPGTRLCECALSAGGGAPCFDGPRSSRKPAAISH